MFSGSRYLSPRNLSVLAATLCSVALVVLTWIALTLPSLSVSWRVHGEHIAVLDSSRQWQAVLALRGADGRSLAMPATFAIEEPDFLPDWAAYNSLLQTQAESLAVIERGGATLQLADGSRVAVSVERRDIGELPWDYWMQLAFGLIALTVGFGVWAFRPRTQETAILLVTAIGFAAGIWSAAIYSTRDLLMPADIFRVASVINHGGALLFDCAMAALLWHYPRPLGRRRVPLYLLLAWLLLWTLDTLQVVDSLSLGFYLWLLLIFLLALAFAIAQWRRAERDPVARAALQWLLLSFMIGSGTFVALQIVPRVLGIDVPVPQSVLAGAFLIVYLGLAAGISRYQLFHLERWWRVTWSWLLGGVLVVLVDALLLWQLQLGQEVALAMAIAIAGWAYFPLRQWLLARLLRLDIVSTELRPAAVRTLFDLSTTGELEARWPELLDRVFHPLSMTQADGEDSTGIGIAEHGLHLYVPGLAAGTGLRLSGCERGTRLFRPEDVRIAQDLHGIALHAQQTVVARAQGALRERTRIKRDLHDDMGARLLSILHGSNAGEMQEEARSAIHDLRQMLATLDEQSVPVDDAVALVTSEARERCRREGVAFRQEVLLARRASFSARQFANIKRIVREGVTNALKYAGGNQVEVVFAESAGNLEIVVSDNGNFSEVAIEKQGRGHHIVRSRVAELGGEVSWSRNEAGGCRLRAVIPWTMPSSLVD